MDNARISFHSAFETSSSSNFSPPGRNFFFRKTTTTTTSTTLCARTIVWRRRRRRRSSRRWARKRGARKISLLCFRVFFIKNVCTQFPIKISYSLLLICAYTRREESVLHTLSSSSLSFRRGIHSLSNKTNDRLFFFLFLSFSLLLFKYYRVSSHRIYISSFVRETVFFGDGDA